MHRREKKAERKSKNSAVSRKGRKGKFLQVSLQKKCKVGVRRDKTELHKWRKQAIYEAFSFIVIPI